MGNILPRDAWGRSGGGGVLWRGRAHEDGLPGDVREEELFLTREEALSFAFGLLSSKLPHLEVLPCRWEDGRAAEEGYPVASVDLWADADGKVRDVWEAPNRGGLYIVRDELIIIGRDHDGLEADFKVPEAYRDEIGEER